MHPTYQGILQANRIEWVADIPPNLPAEGKVRVLVTFLESPAVLPAEPAKPIAAAMAALAALPPNPELADPVAWQQNIREDRALPGRED